MRMEAVAGDAHGQQNFRWEVPRQVQDRGNRRIHSRTPKGSVRSPPAAYLYFLIFRRGL